MNLTEDERTELLAFLKQGKPSVGKVARAHMLLLADEGQTDERIAATLHVGRATVERTRQKCVEGGLDWAWSERSRPGARRKLAGKQEALLVALACTDAPNGRSTWSLQLLADRLVALDVVDAVSDETVRRTLKKTI